MLHWSGAQPLKTPNLHLAFLGRYLLPQRWQVVSLALLVMSAIALQLSAPWIFGAFVDAARAGESAEKLARFGLYFIGITLVLQGVNVASAITASRMGWQATNALRLDLAAHCLSLDQEFHKRHSSGELLERVDGDAGVLVNFFSKFAIDLVGNALLLVGVVAVLFRLDWRIGLSATGFALLALGSLMYLRGFARSAWLSVREAATRFYGFLGEALAGIEDIRANGAGDYVMRRFHELLRAWLPTRRRATFLFSIAWALPLIIFAVGDAMAFVLSSRLHTSGVLSLGVASTVFFYIALLARPIEQIRAQLQNLQQVDASLGRVQRLLSEQSVLQKSGGISLPEGPLELRFDGVSFAYEKGRPVLNNVSFHIAPGRTLGLLGRTGSGKTTLSRLLFRWHDPQAGRILLGGIPLQELPLAQLRARVGLVTQDVQLFSASVRDNLTFFDDAVPKIRVLEALYNVGLGEWCARLPNGLDTPLTPSTLSAGEAQLLALARIYLGDPQLVILDEASSRLDRATEAQLDRALEGLLRGRTAIVIAHRLATVRRADDLLVLGGGEVLEHGTYTQLAQDPNSHFAALLKTGLEEIIQ